MSKVAVIGAGKTGRGFLGRLLKEAGDEIVFIDKNQQLVDELNEEGFFYVNFFGNEKKPLKIDHFKAYTWENVSFSELELILVSVGGRNLEDVGQCLARQLNDDKNYYVITCENASHPSEILRKAIHKSNVFISEATVFCTTTEAKGTDIVSENYPCLQYDVELLNGYIPNTRQIKPVENFSNFLTRKLYTYNAASCVIAYLGWLKGYTDYAKAANDPEIQRLLDENYQVTNRVLCEEFGYEKEDQEEFALLSRKKFCDSTIQDTISRNAREPQRKLESSERIIGPIRLLYKYGECAEVLEKTAAAAILYRTDDDDEWRNIQKEKSPEQILIDICGLNPQEEAFSNILRYVRIFQEVL